MAHESVLSWAVLLDWARSGEARWLRMAWLTRLDSAKTAGHSRLSRQAVPQSLTWQLVIAIGQSKSRALRGRGFREQLFLRGHYWSSHLCAFDPLSFTSRLLACTCRATVWILSEHPPSAILTEPHPSLLLSSPVLRP